MKLKWIVVTLVVGCSGLTHGALVEASAVQARQLAVYDMGKAIVRERRMVPFAQGVNTVRFDDVPARMDPASVNFSPPVRVMNIQSLEFWLQNDLESMRSALMQYRSSPVMVKVTTATREFSGKLLGISGEANEPLGVMLEQDDGPMVVVDWNELVSVELPGADKKLQQAPALFWRTQTDQDSMQSVRLNYVVSDFSWRVEYEMLLNERRDVAWFSGRIRLDNQSGGAYEDVSLRLIATREGVRRESARAAAREPARASSDGKTYRLGQEAVSLDPYGAGLDPVFSYQLPQHISLEDQQSKVVELLSVEQLPVKLMYVYDGVLFDRFQRNRRNDWSYGTESKPQVDVYVSFENRLAAGLGQAVPPGVLRLVQRTEGGGLELLGESFLDQMEDGERASVRMGEARGLSGNRHRMSYRELVPLHEYEESFQIRLVNDTEQDVEIRVIEHLYRWSNYEIVKADAPYNETTAGVIEFTPLIKAGGSRELTYTVRYRW